MNRRKMFGILAAPVAAANIPVQSEIKTDLKPYSEFDYGDIYKIWKKEFLKRKYNLMDSEVIFNSGSDFINGYYGLIDRMSLDIGRGTWDARLAFADACLNGEVPGVWWE